MKFKIWRKFSNRKDLSGSVTSDVSPTGFIGDKERAVSLFLMKPVCETPDVANFDKIRNLFGMNCQVPNHTALVLLQWHTIFKKFSCEIITSVPCTFQLSLP